MNSNELTESPEDELSPFVETAGNEHFYPVKARVNLLADIKQDISELVSVILLTGESGSGKSTICRKLVVDGFPDRKTLHFKNSVQSFEDVVRSVAETVNVEVHDLSRKGITEALANIVGSVEESGAQIVLVCDVADRIYLATLERIRKMLDALNVTTVHLQVIFIGAESLLENINQLKICDFADVPESRYVLKPLSLSETTTYLEHCCKLLPLAKAKIFTPAIVDKIYQASRGNLDEINTLSQKLLTGGVADVDNVLSVSSTPIAKKLVPKRVEKLVPAGFGKIKLSWPLIGGVGGGIAIGLTALLMMGGGDDKPGQEAGSTPQVVEKQLEVIQPELADEKELSADALKPINTDSEIQAVEPVQATAEIEVTPPEKEVVEKQVVAEPVELELSVAEVVKEKIVKDISSEAEKVKELPISEEPKRESVPTQVVEDVVTQVADPIVVAAPVQKIKKIEEPVEIPVLKPEKIKVLVEAEKGEDALIENKDGSSIVISSLTSADEVNVPLLRGDDEKKKIVGDEVPPKVELVQQKEVRVIAEKAKEIVAEQNNVEPIASEQSPAIEKQKELIVQEDEVTPKKVQQVNEVIVPEPEGVTNSALYNSRRAAGKSWLSGKRNDKYTMQLMVLSSESAEDKMNEILAREGYAKAADAFYIFKKDSTPPSVFVFYGEYNSMTEAREARNKVSKLLKKHKPYVLSVAGAMRKVK